MLQPATAGHMPKQPVQDSGTSGSREAATTFSAPTVRSSGVAMSSPPPRAKRSLSGLGSSTIQPAQGPPAPDLEQFVILNPPRSNTKGRKKGRYLAGIELQATKTNLCGICGEPGHNLATCPARLGNNQNAQE